MNQETWYDLRDLRTDSCEFVNDRYKAAEVAVFVTEDIADIRVQAMCRLSMLMLARWCRRISLFSSDAASCLTGEEGSFLELLTRVVRASDPQCQLVVNPTRWSTQVSLFVGSAADDHSGDFVAINGMGWSAGVAYNQPFSSFPGAENDLLIGPCFAACLGNSELFRYFTGRKPRRYEKWYSLWENEVYDGYCPPSKVPNIGEINLGRVHLVGCGSIGSSFAYLLPYFPLRGQWLLVDPDKVEGQNTSSSLLFTAEDARRSIGKTLCSKEYLRSAGIQVQTFEDEYSRWAYDHEKRDLHSADVILCFANEHNIWNTIQQLYPPVCFHATTSKSWGLHIGRHIPLIENCIMCTFKDLVTVKYVPRCAEGELPGGPDNDFQTDKSEHTAILPFLAPAAAILTISELIKALGTDQPFKDNTTEFNMSTFEGVFLGSFQGFRNCHICSHQAPLYTEFGPAGVHWHLSQTGQ